MNIGFVHIITPLIIIIDLDSNATFKKIIVCPTLFRSLLDFFVNFDFCSWVSKQATQYFSQLFSLFRIQTHRVSI